MVKLYKLQLLVLSVFVLLLTSCDKYTINSNKVTYDGYEFQVLSPGLIAVQKEGVHIATVNDEFPSCDFQVVQNGQQLEVHTSKCSLVYTPGEETLAERIQIIYEGISGQVQAEISQVDKQNLGGVIKSVDRCDGRLEYSEYDYTSAAKPLQIPNGLLSQRGFTVLKSVEGTLKHSDTDGMADALFIFCYGSDYKSALKDFTQLNGQVPLLPKWTLGTWFSRYQPLSANDYKNIVNRFRKEQIPIDVIVPDMNWHIDGWFGTRYDLEKFPDMKGFFDWTHKNGIHVGFNHHPGAVIRDDERAKMFCQQAGLDYDSLLQATIKQYEESGWEFIENALFYGEGNPDHIKPFFDVFLSPIMDEGLDFHWVDGTPSTKNLEQYYKLTETHNQQRAIVLTRQVAGSFDHHRYPIGFSADSYISWESLKFNTELTVMGANNGVYWSHDIGGHMECFGDIDYSELFTRWVQAGAMSPFCRLHATGGVEWDKRLVHCRQPWKWGDKVLDATQKILQLKYKLMPYTYSLNRQAHDDGLLICHGMYMDYPSDAQAYQYSQSQYMFGPSVLVAPIITPAEDQKGTDGKAKHNVWIPEGTWYDYFSGEAINGPVETLVAKPIDEMPLYIKEGAIIPMMDYMDYTDQKPLDNVTIEFYQATNSMATSFDLYEDDGVSLAYQNGKSQWTTIEYAYKQGQGTKVVIHPVKGQYEGGVKVRNYNLVFKYIKQQPSRVLLNGKSMNEDAISFEGDRLSIMVKDYDVNEPLTIEL